MKSNCKVIREAMERHILECIDEMGENDKERLEAVRDQFLFTHGYEFIKPRHANVQEKFMELLNALGIDCLYKTHEIIEFLTKIGLPLPEGKDGTDSTEFYQRLYYRDYVKLCDNNGIDFISNVMNYKG